MPRINPNATNKHNLPDIFYDTVAYDPYDGYKSPDDSISVTEIIDAPQVVWLRRKYKDQIQFDVSDGLPALLGSAVHNLFERPAKLLPNKYVVEKKLKVVYEGWKISGRMDGYDLLNNHLYDVKVTSVWGVILDDHNDWVMQLNIYAMFLRHVGYFDDITKQYVRLNPSQAYDIALLKDWNETKSKFERDYPKLNVHVKNVKLYSDSQVDAWLKKRLALHAEARDAVANGGDIPMCTDSDRWAKPNVYAVHTVGSSRASKLCETKEEADEYILSKIKIGEVNFISAQVMLRPGENTRCERYCPVKDFCPQYNKYYKVDQDGFIQA